MCHYCSCKLSTHASKRDKLPLVIHMLYVTFHFGQLCIFKDNDTALIFPTLRQDQFLMLFFNIGAI